MLALMVCLAVGFIMMMSASDPAAITPFLGYRLKAFATLVLVTRTKSEGVMIPAHAEHQLQEVMHVFQARVTAFHQQKV